MRTPIEIVEELTKLTDEEIANILEISRQTVISYKKGTTTIPSDKLVKLSRATGVSLDTMLGNIEVYTSPKIRKVYSRVAERVTTALKAGKEDLERIRKHDFGDKYPQVATTKEQVLADLTSVLRIAGAQSQKPLAGFMGLSDVGKSTIINYLLGSPVIPASYGPLTSVTTYFMSTAERPKFLCNPLENAIVLGRKPGSGMERFIHGMLDDEDYVRGYLLKKGDAKSILNAYGTRNGAFYEDDSILLDEIVVFIDAPILEEVTLVDFPGFGTGEEKDDISLTIDASRFDILFFLSRANGFLSTEEEISSLAHILQGREKADSLYVLATHANSIGDPGKVETILDGGCTRLVQVLSDDACARLGITIDNHARLRRRFFGFAPQSDFYCKRLNTDIEITFPAVIEKKLGVAEEDFFSAVKSYAEQIEDTIENLDRIYGENIEPVGEDEVNVVLSSINSRYTRLKKELRDEVSACREKSRADFKKKYSEIVNENYIVDAIKRKDFKNRKKDLEALGDYISQELNEAYTAVCNKYSKRFSDKLTDSLTQYQEAWGDSKVTISMTDFDFARAFASGLTGITTFGALAMWASVVAAGSNLGAYILVAKVVSALTAIGINLGGTATVVAWVSAIGGPITLGIAFAVIGAATVFGIISGTWKSRVAKKFVKEFEKNNSLKKCLDGFDGYWNDTEVALDKALEAMHKQAKDEYIRKVENQKMAYNDKIALKTILTMLYEQVKGAYNRMVDAIEAMSHSLAEDE